LFVAVPVSCAGFDEGDKHVLQTQILRLVSDLIPNSDGILIIGSTAGELQERYERETPASVREDVSSAIAHVCEEGAFEDDKSGLVPFLSTCQAAFLAR
jgi:hypothetical protein